MKNKVSIKVKAALKTAAYIVCAVALLSPAVQAQQAGNKTTDAIYIYSGTDRHQRLIDNARKEGGMTFYTSMAPTESRPLVDAFEKKYGIKVNLWRASNENLIQRITTEAQSKRHTFDVLETNGTVLEIMSREKLLSPFYTPYEADFPPTAVPANKMWMPTRLNYLVTAFNTDKVKREELPKTYEGFTDPKWKNRLTIEVGDWDWRYTIQGQLSEEKAKAFIKNLASQNPELRKGHPLLAKLVGAGEVPISLTTFLSNVISEKRTGSPIDYVPITPVLAVPFGIGLAKHAPHPHSAALFADYVLSPEGQQLLESLGRLPASTKVKQTSVNFPFVVLDVNASIDDSEKRQKVWDDTFIKR